MIVKVASSRLSRPRQRSHRLAKAKGSRDLGAAGRIAPLVETVRQHEAPPPLEKRMFDAKQLPPGLSLCYPGNIIK